MTLAPDLKPSDLRLRQNEPLARARRLRARQRRVLVKVGYSCNDRCVFCHTEAYRHAGDTATDALIDKVRRASLEGFDMVVFSGGEPTMRKDLFRLSRAARESGVALGFITNGRVLSYPDVIERLLDDGLAYAQVSLHGVASVHDRQVRSKAFEQTFAAVEKLHGRIELTVSCVVNRLNADQLRPLVDLLLAFEDLTFKLACCEPKGEALRRRELIVPPIAEAAAAVRDAIAYGLEARGERAGPSFAVEGFPYCLVPEAREIDDDLMANRLVAMSEVWDEGLVEIDDFNKTKPTPCQGCALDTAGCPGLFVETHRLEGASMLRPLREGRDGAPRQAGGLPVPWVREELRPDDLLPIEEARSVVAPGFDEVAVIPVVRPSPGDPPVRPSTGFGIMASIRAQAGRVSSVQLVGRALAEWQPLAEVISAARTFGVDGVWLQDLESRPDLPAPPVGPDCSELEGAAGSKMVPRELWWPLLAGG
jgi:MoaA/NifB/PqqE/SkfB family radical SAM enzyme